MYAEVLGLGVRSFAITNIVLGRSSSWSLCIAIIREQKNLAAMKERGELPEEEPEAA